MGFWDTTFNIVSSVVKASSKFLQDQQEKFIAAEEYYERRGVDDWDKEEFIKEYERNKGDMYRSYALRKKAEEKYGNNE